jgi:hypothetical protein
MTIQSSIFALEICARLHAGAPLRGMLRELVANHPERTGHQGKWAMYRRAAELLRGSLDVAERGCWDYFDDHARAMSEFDNWSSWLKTEEGARKSPSGLDPYRGEPRYMTFTMVLLLVQNSPSDQAMAKLCDIPEAALWSKDTFARILSGMGVINFASVQADVVYLIPGDEGWGLTSDDLAQPKFNYLRPLV